LDRTGYALAQLLGQRLHLLVRELEVFAA
jgi:hypothetical protein